MLEVISLLVFFLAIAPVVRLFFKKAFVRRLSLFPRKLYFLICAVVGYLGVAATLILAFPQLLPVPVVLACCIALYLYVWRARSNYGSRRGLPPGSLAIAPTGPWTDYLYYRKAGERHGAIYKMSNVVKPMVCINDLAVAREFLKRFEDSLDTPPLPFNHHIPGEFIRYMTPQGRALYRSRMAAVFSNNTVFNDHEEFAISSVRETLAGMANETSVDPVPLIERSIFSIFLKLFAGISSSDPEFARLRSLYRQIDYRRAFFTTRRSVERNLNEIEYVFTKYAGSPRNSFLKLFVESVPGFDLEIWSAKTVYRNFIYLLQTSWIDVADLMVWVFKQMCDHPEWKASVRSLECSRKIDRINADDDWARGVVIETLRLEQSEYLMRRTRQDIQYRGYLIPRGWLVRVGVREAHRDKAVFERPDEFRPDRFFDRRVDQGRFFPLGVGHKSCLGQHLVTWICKIFVLELANGFETEVANDGPRELGVFHWRPSSRFRVRVTPLGASYGVAGNYRRLYPAIHPPSIPTADPVVKGEA